MKRENGSNQNEKISRFPKCWHEPEDKYGSGYESGHQDEEPLQPEDLDCP